MTEPRGHHPADLESVRTAYDSVRELFQAKLDGVMTEIRGLKVLIDERESISKARVDAQDRAVAAALVAQEKAVSAALAAAEKAVNAAFLAAQTAVDKAEAAQTAYNLRSNEFRAALDDAQKTFMPRTEASAEALRSAERLDDLKRELALLRELMVHGEAVLRDERVKAIAAARDEFNGQIASLNVSRGESGGRQAGQTSLVALVVSVVGGVAGIVGIIAFLASRG